jgi:3-phenylpropionate/trans-cinnamate dioxygenase ferredoxin subunit
VHADDGEFYAAYDECSHAQIPLSEGEIEGCTLECWLHGSRFDLRTGKPSGPPASEPVPVYPTHIADGDLYVSLVPSNGVNP